MHVVCDIGIAFLFFGFFFFWAGEEDGGGGRELEATSLLHQRKTGMQICMCLPEQYGMFNG